MRVEELFDHYAAQIAQDNDLSKEQQNIRTLLRLTNGPVETMTANQYNLLRLAAAPEGGSREIDQNLRIRVTINPYGNVLTPAQILLRPTQGAGETKPEELLRPGSEK